MIPAYLPNRGLGKKLRETMSAFGAQRVYDAMRYICEGRTDDANWWRNNRPTSGRLLESICYHTERFAESWASNGARRSNMSYDADQRPIVGVNGVASVQEPPSEREYDGDIPL